MSVCNDLFTDDFESGQAIGTLYSTTGFGDPQVAAGVGRDGGYGVECQGAVQGGRIWNTTDFAPGVRSGCASWDLWLSADGLTAVGDAYWFIVTVPGGGGGLFRFGFSGASAPYTLDVYEGGGASYPGVVPGGQWIRIRAEWTFSEAATAGDGIARIYIGDDDDSLVLIHENTALDDFGLGSEWGRLLWTIDLEGFLDNIAVGRGGEPKVFSHVDAVAGRDLIIGRVVVPSESAYWSGIAFTDQVRDPGRHHQPRVISFGDLRSAASDRSGRLQATSAQLRLQDKTSDADAPPVRGWLARANTRTLRGREIRVDLNSDKGIIRGDLWLTVFRGFIEQWEGPPFFGITIEALAWVFKQLAKPVLTDTIAEHFSAAPVSTRDRKIPLAVGRLSDEASAHPAPVVIVDVDAPGSTGGSDPQAGYRTMPGSLAVATGLTIGDSGSGAFLTGDSVRFMAVAEYPDGSLSNPDDNGNGDGPVGNIDGTPHTVSSDNVGILVQASGGLPSGAVAVRFYIGDTLGGVFRWQHYIRTTDPATGVLFDANPGSGGQAADGTTISTNGVWASDRFAYAAVRGVMTDGRTILSAVVFISTSGYERPRSFAWDPPATGTVGHYEVLWIEALPPVANAGNYSRRFIVPTDQLNSASKPYWEYDWGATGWDTDATAKVPEGMIPPIDCGNFTALDGSTWRGFLMSGRPGLEFESAYFKASDGTIEKIGDGDYGVDIAAPGRTGYSTYFGANPYFTTSTGLKCFMVFLRGPKVNRALGTDGFTQERFGVNVKGADTVGDASGTLIDDVVDVTAWLLDNGALADVATLIASGLFATTPPTFSDGSSRRDVASFAAAKTDLDVVTPSGRAVARWITGDLTYGDLLAELAVNGPFLIIPHLDGSVGIAVTNPDRDIVATLTEDREIERGSFRFKDAVQGYYNRRVYRSGPRYDASGAVSFDDEGLANDLVSQGATGNDEIVPNPSALDLAWRVSAVAAKEIADHDLRLSAYLPRTVPVTSGMHWVHFKGGQNVAITHREHVHPVDEKHAILGLQLAIDLTRVSLTCLDLRTAVGQLSAFQVEYFMGNQPLGGSRVDTCLTEAGVIVLINYALGIINWSEIPATHEVVYDVWVATKAGTITPNLYEYPDDTGDTAVVTGTSHNTDTLTRQQHVVPRGTGVVEYWALPVLGGGAVDTDARMPARLRIRKIGSEA